MDAADNAQAKAALKLLGTLNEQGEVIPDPLTRATTLIEKLEEALTLSNRIRSVLSKMFAKAELWGYIPRGQTQLGGRIVPLNERKNGI